VLLIAVAIDVTLYTGESDVEYKSGLRKEMIRVVRHLYPEACEV
jgi:hypothetical protein